MRGVENSESGCGILNCDIYHLFWISLGWLHLLLWKLLDDLLDICCMYIISCRISLYVCYNIKL